MTSDEFEELAERMSVGQRQRFVALTFLMHRLDRNIAQLRLLTEDLSVTSEEVLRMRNGPYIEPYDWEGMAHETQEEVDRRSQEGEGA